MARSIRIDVEGGIHHVVNRGVDRMPIFYDDADRVEFGRLLGVVHDRFGMEVIAYCLMTNHFHLLVRCPSGGVSQAMHLLTSVHARHVNERAGRDGPLFRGRFRSRIISDDSYLLAALRYVHRNPLDIAGIESPDAYRWSSHRTYLGHRAVPPFMDLSVLDRHFGGSAQAFHEFVSDGPLGSPADLGRLTPDLVADAARVVIEQMMVDVPPNQERPVLHLVAQRLDAHAPGALDVLLPQLDADARRRAFKRTEARVVSAPWLTEAALRTLDVLGLASEMYPAHL